MSVDPKKFGLTPSLVETVKEALKGSQHKIDVAPPHGKITGADFKKLRGEETKKTNEAAEKKIPAGHYWSSYNGKVTKMLTPGTRVKTKHGVGVVKSAHSSMDWDDDNDSHYIVNVNGKNEKIWADDLVGKGMGPKRINVKEDVQTEADDPVAKQIAAKKDQLKKQIQQKIAQKQMQVMQSKAQKRLSNINASNDKCSCGDTNESKMKCEVHGDKHNEKNKEAKMGREKIEVNPPLREAEDLPKKVIKKGHEIAKSLIKHRSKVREPYAVGMATAKKSAGIKAD